ncbi:putative DNA binding domain-containing protein, partial [bacterium]|nr:putative DNA binding domain-containing protein [bacterium]
MRVEDLKNLINRNESTVVEWKPSLSQMKEIINTISAFANTEGGKVFVGVSKAGELLGTQIGKGTIENLTNQISQHTDPKVHPRITTKKMEDREIIIIDVKESADHLVLAFGQPHKRVGRSTVRMSKDEYERLILEKHKDKIQFDSQMCEGAQLKDIDKSKVKWFLQRAKEERDFDVSPNISAKEAVERMGLVKDNGLTNTAVLFFARNPQRFILHSRIRCARFKGTDGLDYIDMNVLDGTVIELRQKALKFIMQHTKHAVFFDANRRYDRWEYPLRALEEVLSNALAHRDYYSNAEIQLSIYDDRIEVWNP